MALQEKHIIGFLGKISRVSVYGWASYPDDKTPIEVKLFVNNKIVKSKLAEDYRKGIKTKGMHPTGYCGFHFELDEDQVLNQNDKVSVKAGKHDIALTGSPKIFDSKEIKELYPKISKDRKLELRESHEFINDRLFFIHVPKTGGTSFRTMLKKLFKKREVYPRPRQIKQHGGYPHFTNLIALNKEERNKIKLLCGHYSFIVGDIFAGDVKHITFLRDPVKRCVSYLFHLKRKSPYLSYHELLKIRGKQIHNHQVRFFADRQLSEKLKYFSSAKLDKQALDQAKENLGKCCFVGINEEFNTSVKLFEKIFDVQLGLELKLNVTNSSMNEIDEALLDKIRKENTLDIEFYKFACDKFTLLKEQYK